MSVMELVLIQAGNDRRHKIQLSTKATVSELLQRTAAATQCPLKTIRLFYSGRELKPPEAKVSSFRLGEHGSHIIHMTTKVVEIPGEAIGGLSTNRTVARPSFARESSSGTLVDLTLTHPSTTSNLCCRSASRSAISLQSEIAAVSIDLTEGDSPLSGTRTEPPILTGRASKILPGTRVVPLVMECPRQVTARLRRLESQRLYLLDQAEESSDRGLSKRFSVMGSTGSEFIVVLGEKSGCTCPDANGPNAVLPCKHIVFVLVKVLKIDVSSPLIYQRGFLESELVEMLDVPRHRESIGSSYSVSSSSSSVSSSSSTNIPGASSISFLKSGIFKHLPLRSTVHELRDDEDTAAGEIGTSIALAPRLAPEIPECPICFEKLGGFLAEANRVVRCITCDGAVHDDCIKKWIKRSRTCPCCRGGWAVTKIGAKKRRLPAAVASNASSTAQQRRI